MASGVTWPGPSTPLQPPLNAHFPALPRTRGDGPTHLPSGPDVLATGLVTPDGSLQCTLFMKTAPTNSGRLFYEGDHCGAEVFFGCPITGCLPLPVSDEAPCTL